MIEWIKIEEGGPMPDPFEIVATAKNDISEPWWAEGLYIGGTEFEHGNGIVRDDATHWARVELPDGN